MSKHLCKASRVLVTVVNSPSAHVCRELATLGQQSLHLQVQQSRPVAPMATRDIYLTARPVEVYPVIHQALSECVRSPKP